MVEAQALLLHKQHQIYKHGYSSFKQLKSTKNAETMLLFSNNFSFRTVV